MDRTGIQLRKSCVSCRAAHAMHRWAALFFIVVCTMDQFANSQGYEDTPTIRVETREVLIPTRVSVLVPDRSFMGGRLTGYYDVVHLGVRDFHLFEDEKEQPITSAALVRPYGTALLQDNLGYQQGIALTPGGEWTRLRVSPGYTPLLNIPLYIIAYRPPGLLPEGSCHRIKITVDPRDASGHRLTEAEIHGVVNLTWGSRSEEVKRSKLLLRYRTQYCDVAHAASDPLNGAQVGKELENLAMGNAPEEEEGFYVSSFDLFDESGKSHTRVALDFPQLSLQTGNPGFQAALLGVFTNSHGDLATRFSDSAPEGCSFPWKNESAALIKAMCGSETFFNHYETEATLPPGGYGLRLAIDFGGTLRRAEAPVSVPAPARGLAVSGIALCRRYFARDPVPTEAQLPPDDIPTMPFDLKPLVSKGIEFTPTGDMHFKKHDPLAAYFEVYEPLVPGNLLQVAGHNVQVQFEMRVVDAKTGEVKSDTGFRPADEFVNPGHAVIPISAMVKIEELAPGNYQLQVRAKDSAGNSTDWRSTSFTRE